MKLKLETNRPAVTGFRRKDLGDGNFAIFETTIDELVFADDNSPVLDAQIRAIEAVLPHLKKLQVKAKEKTEKSRKGDV